jgi:hypothetical protein
VKQSEIYEMFGDGVFEGEFVETVLCSASGANGSRVRLVAVIRPMDDELRYRLERGNHYHILYENFRLALKNFREAL